MTAYSSELDRANISVQEAMKLKHGAGGKAVWAHPFYTYEKFQKIRISDLSEKTILAMRSCESDVRKELDAL